MLETRFQEIQDQIHQACLDHQRDPDSVSLLAVSKTRSAAEVSALAALGQRHFGENYVQEGVDKITTLATPHPDLCWHFIGPIQSNKTRAIAEHFHWVHSIDRLKIARRLSAQRPDSLPPLQVCLQLNVDLEDSKSGVALEPVAPLLELAREVQALPRLQLRGLMAIPRADSKDRNRNAFHKVAMTLSYLRNTMPELDCLSMGMSGDFPQAIAEGATFVRIGTALFGPRN